MKKSLMLAAAGALLLGVANASFAQMQQDSGTGKPLGGTGVTDAPAVPNAGTTSGSGSSSGSGMSSRSGSSSPSQGQTDLGTPKGPANAPGIVDPKSPRDPLKLEQGSSGGSKQQQ